MVDRDLFEPNIDSEGIKNLQSLHTPITLLRFPFLLPQLFNLRSFLRTKEA
jgi:hypothetical protein